MYRPAESCLCRPHRRSRSECLTLRVPRLLGMPGSVSTIGKHLASLDRFYGWAPASTPASPGRWLTACVASLTMASSTTIPTALNTRLSGSEISRRSIYRTEFSCQIASDSGVCKGSSEIPVNIVTPGSGSGRITAYSEVSPTMDARERIAEFLRTDGRRSANGAI